MMENNWPCKCGHEKTWHDKGIERDLVWEGICQAPVDWNKLEGKITGKWPFCYHDRFEPDNLRYLEQLYESRNK
jgi:hypothetical protein